MGVALSVFKLKNPDNIKLMKDMDARVQKTLEDFNLYDDLGKPNSFLKFQSHDKENDVVKYKATHYSETIKHPIRIFISDIEEGFADIPIEKIKKAKGTKRLGKHQRIYNFDVLIDRKNEEICVFTVKKAANSFMNRFKKNKRIEYEDMFFDLSKASEQPELLNIWGVWQTGRGRCRTKAFFGTEIHKLADIDNKLVKSYNVEYEDEEGNIWDLFISKDCRISSKSTMLKNDHLYKTYQFLKSKLTIKNKDEVSTEAFVEEGQELL